MEFQALELPKRPKNGDIIFGTPMQPIDKMKIMSSEEFEEMVLEWAFDYLQGRYHTVQRIGGAGDKGRDVIAYLDDSLQQFDIFQCKHYSSPLAPSQYWTEFGKLCYYTFNGDYAKPNQYFIVTSQGLGPAMRALVDNPGTINGHLIAAWEQHCKRKITDTKEIELFEPLKKYIQEFDFSIVKDIAPLRLVSEYEQTKWFKYRFGGGLQKRPKRQEPPESVDAAEAKLPYVTELLEVYSEYAHQAFHTLESLKSASTLYSHFERQRRDYHSAQSLKRFSRDEFIDEDPYEDAKNEIFGAVIDIAEQKYENGYDRVNTTLREARRTSLDGNDLGEIKPSDKSGMCHELVNETKLKWVE